MEIARLLPWNRNYLLIWMMLMQPQTVPQDWITYKLLALVFKSKQEPQLWQSQHPDMIFTPYAICDVECEPSSWRNAAATQTFQTLGKRYPIPNSSHCGLVSCFLCNMISACITNNEAFVAIWQMMTTNVTRSLIFSSGCTKWIVA